MWTRIFTTKCHWTYTLYNMFYLQLDRFCYCCITIRFNHKPGLYDRRRIWIIYGWKRQQIYLDIYPMNFKRVRVVLQHFLKRFVILFFWTFFESNIFFTNINEYYNHTFLIRNLELWTFLCNIFRYFNYFFRWSFLCNISNRLIGQSSKETQ